MIIHFSIQNTPKRLISGVNLKAGDLVRVENETE